MNISIKAVKPGLILVIFTLIFGISLGAYFGIAEDSIQAYIAEGIAAHPELHGKNSADKIWRYAQRAHFHATGIAAFTIGLVLLTMLSSLSERYKTWTSLLIGLGGLYPLSWFTLFVLSPSMGRDTAHHYWLTELFAYVGVTSLLLGIALLCANLFFDKFQSAE